MKILVALLMTALLPTLSSAREGQQSPPVPQPAGASTGQASGGGTTSKSDLANAANDPTSPTTLLQFRDVIALSIPGANGAGNVFQIQPVVPFAQSRWLPFDHMVKMTLPLGSVPAPWSVSGVGDVELFDLVSIRQSWGRWGVGPALVFPTATSNDLGQGKWQAGPAVAVIYTGTKHLILGAVLQNPVSYAGDQSRPAVNNLIIIPTLTYNLPDGWFAGLGDFNLTFNWKEGGAATIPLGPQAGRVVKFGRQPVAISAEAAYVVARPSSTPTPRWLVGVELTFILRNR